LSEDPYSVLGVSKDARPEDIQKAYRKLAKKLHPGLNPGNKLAEERFKSVSAAYDLLSDPEKRARFDRARSTHRGRNGRGTVITAILLRQAPAPIPTPHRKDLPILPKTAIFLLTSPAAADASI
jgi:curved DNA-binding protein CbpA